MGYDDRGAARAHAAPVDVDDASSQIAAKIQPGLRDAIAAAASSAARRRPAREGGSRGGRQLLMPLVPHRARDHDAHLWHLRRCSCTAYEVKEEPVDSRTAIGEINVKITLTATCLLHQRHRRQLRAGAAGGPGRAQRGRARCDRDRPGAGSWSSSCSRPPAATAAPS